MRDMVPAAGLFAVLVATICLCARSSSPAKQKNAVEDGFEFSEQANGEVRLTYRRLQMGCTERACFLFSFGFFAVLLFIGLGSLLGGFDNHAAWVPFTLLALTLLTPAYLVNCLAVDRARPGVAIITPDAIHVEKNFVGKFARYERKYIRRIYLSASGGDVADTTGAESPAVIVGSGTPGGMVLASQLFARSVIAAGFTMETFGKCLGRRMVSVHFDYAGKRGVLFARALPITHAQPFVDALHRVLRNT